MIGTALTFKATPTFAYIHSTPCFYWFPFYNTTLIVRWSAVGPGLTVYLE